MREILCCNLMVSDVKVVRDTDQAGDVARVMRDLRIGFVPVVDAASHVVGVVTDRDLAVRILGENKPPETPVSEAMTRKVIFVRPEDNIRVAEDKMMMSKINRVLVLRDGVALAGILSVADIATAGEAGETSIIMATRAHANPKPRKGG